MGIESFKPAPDASEKQPRHKDAASLSEGDYILEYEKTFTRADFAGGQQLYLVFTDGSRVGPVDRDDEFSVA